MSEGQDPTTGEVSTAMARTICICALSVLLAAALICRGGGSAAPTSPTGTPAEAVLPASIEKTTAVAPDDPAEAIVALYRETAAEVRAARSAFRARYSSAAGEADRLGVLAEAREYLLGAIVAGLMPAWYGTAWTLNGHSEAPRRGSIACGFFVTTVLRDAGFEVARIAMGRQPSEYIIRNLVPDSQVRRFSDRPVEEVKRAIIAWGRGIYLVGLDLHAGFVVYDGAGPPRFVHSSYYWPARVVSEPVDTENPLKHSRYRVLGCLLNEETLRRWVLVEPFDLRHDYFRR